MAVIYVPLIPAGVMLITPAFSAANWQSLLNDPQLSQAFIATLVSTLIATAGSLFIALGLVAALWPGKHWHRLSARLPWMLAIPHVAFATSALLVLPKAACFISTLLFIAPAGQRRYRIRVDARHQRECVRRVGHLRRVAGKTAGAAKRGIAELWLRAYSAPVLAGSSDHCSRAGCRDACRAGMVTFGC
jgi:hypothetical protein